MQTIDEFVEAYRKIAPPGAARDAAYWWREQDRVMTEMCRAHPSHEDVYEVFAKVSIINRVYRANLQMGANEPEWLVSQALVDRRADRIIARLRTLDSFSATTLPAVVQVHRGVTDVVQKATGKNGTSFVSKYLSFHFPRLVPIYDSRSVERAAALVLQSSGEDKYEQHCRRAICLFEELAKKGIASPELKLIDCLLYG